MNFRYMIRPHVDAELLAAQLAMTCGHMHEAFIHLERAHVLGQASTIEHVRVHWRMLQWAMHQRNIRECLGQVMRIVGAATKTVFGLTPHGNTGGTNVSPFKSMPISPELEARIQIARSSGE